MRDLRSAAFLAVHGEPGIGKTTLLHALADLAREERVRVTDALDDLRPPVVAIVDDLLDEDAETLATLLRKPPGGGVLIAFAYRRAPAALLSALESAARRGLLVDLPLTPLSAEEMAGYPPALQRLSGGNPFYLTELAGQARGVPPKIVASVQEELAALSPSARTLVHGARSPGRTGPRAGRRGPEEDLVALDEAITAGLLKGSGRRYRFRHPIVRRAVYEGTGPGWRLAAHARTADALKAGRPRSARITSSAARRRATRRRSPCSSKPPSKRGPRSPPAGTRRRSGSGATAAVRCSSRSPTRSRPPGGSSTRAARSRRR